MRTSKKVLLERFYGGKWEYKGFFGWVSDDGRYVCPVSNGVDECDNPLPGPYRWHIFGKNCPIRLVDWYRLGQADRAWDITKAAKEK